MSLKDQVVQDNLTTPRKFLGLRLAQTAGLVQDALAMASFDRHKQREMWEHTKGILGMTPTSDGQPTSGAAPGDDVGNINVGDVFHYHQGAPTMTAQTPTTSGMSTLAKAAMVGAACLGTGGIGAGVTAYLLGKAPPAVSTSAPSVYDIQGSVEDYEPTQE